MNRPDYVRQNQPTPMHEIIVGNVGSVYRGQNIGAAEDCYNSYVWASQNSNRSRAYGEDVTWMIDNEPHKEFIGHLDQPEDRVHRPGIRRRADEVIHGLGLKRRSSWSKLNDNAPAYFYFALADYHGNLWKLDVAAGHLIYISSSGSIVHNLLNPNYQPKPPESVMQHWPPTKGKASKDDQPKQA